MCRIREGASQLETMCKLSKTPRTPTLNMQPDMGCAWTSKPSSMFHVYCHNAS